MTNDRAKAWISPSLIQKLKDFRGSLDPDLFEAAHELGATRSYETAVTELLAKPS